MVRFEEKLMTNAVAAWVSSYLDYRRLKKILYDEAEEEAIVLRQWGNSHASIWAAAPAGTASPSLSASPLIEDGDGDGEFDLLAGSCEDGVRDALDLAGFLHAPSGRDYRFREALMHEVVKVDAHYRRTLDQLTTEFEVIAAQAGATRSLRKAQKASRKAALRARRVAGADQLMSSASLPASKAGGHSGGHSRSSARLEVASSANSADGRHSEGRHPEGRVRAQSDALDRDLESLKYTSAEARKLIETKRAYSDLYRQMNFLENFCSMNHTALVKITQKHDKIVAKELGGSSLRPTNELFGGPRNTSAVSREPMTTFVDGAPARLSASGVAGGVAGGFAAPDPKLGPALADLEARTSFGAHGALTELKTRLEVLYASVFCRESVEVAKAELIFKRNEGSRHLHRTMVWPFLLGCRIGVVLLLFIWVMWDVLIDFYLTQYDEQVVFLMVLRYLKTPLIVQTLLVSASGRLVLGVPHVQRGSGAHPLEHHHHRDLVLQGLPSVPRPRQVRSPPPNHPPTANGRGHAPINSLHPSPCPLFALPPVCLRCASGVPSVCLWCASGVPPVCLWYASCVPPVICQHDVCAVALGGTRLRLGHEPHQLHVDARARPALHGDNQGHALAHQRLEHCAACLPPHPLQSLKVRSTCCPRRPACWPPWHPNLPPLTRPWRSRVAKGATSHES